MISNGSVYSSKFGRICVFCGSSMGTNPVYKLAAEQLGEALVSREIKLVYGGGTRGLMGTIASIVHERLGDEGVIGVIPHALRPREVSGRFIGTTEVVDNMHQRKARMAELADAFIALPGGFGTMEELMEMITWHMLGFHKKPVAILNVDGYYDKLLQFFDQIKEVGFVTPDAHKLLISCEDPNKLLDMMESYEASMGQIEISKSKSAFDLPISSQEEK
eukprot:TRINITY_DN4683_c0_g1_i1.p1 TRINITY_DN4683_c0_g1~~TRINITY_DN4683_c0_g1_i1.p1  ORF type:complete len:219 (-),score=44.52 TRINITY_DN4683_c0_g1_i1:378-1034(-)